MIEIGTEVPELLPEHADGTIWADVEGDLWMPQWMPMLGGAVWISVKRLPFSISSCMADPVRAYGPYRAVLAPPPIREQDGLP